LIPQLRPAELAAWRADPARTPPVLVDVREPWEFDLCRIDGSLPVPMGELGARAADLPRDRPLVMVCHHGNRSFYAATMLAHAGFPDVHNLQGGVEAWAADVDPAMRRY